MKYQLGKEAVLLSGSSEEYYQLSCVYTLPQEFVVSQNYPNPFIPVTRIKYQLPKTSEVKMTVYNLRSELIETLVNNKQEDGYYSSEFESKNLSSGIYFYRIEAEEFISVMKCMIVKKKWRVKRLNHKREVMKNIFLSLMLLVFAVQLNGRGDATRKINPGHHREILKGQQVERPYMTSSENQRPDGRFRDPGLEYMESAESDHQDRMGIEHLRQVKERFLQQNISKLPAPSASVLPTDWQVLVPDFEVNENVGRCDHYDPRIATASDGSYIVIWEDNRNGNSDIYAQRYNSSGTKVGANLLVNDDGGSSYQLYPSIAMDGSGNFVITWEDERNGNSDIYAQFYKMGEKTGDNFKLSNDDNAGTDEYWPACVFQNDRLVTCWETNRIPGQGWDIFANILGYLNVQVVTNSANAIPSVFALKQNYPNPFNMSTTIQYQLPEKAFVKISIYNLNGQIIETLVSQDKPAGYYNTIWDARQITSGVYIYRIDAGNFHDVRKCVIVK